MDERTAFLRALEADEDDVTTRMVYADWLDERGEHEEADRQRKWPAAKAWLLQFVRGINYPVYRVDGNGGVVYKTDERGDPLRDEYGEPIPEEDEDSLGEPHTYEDAIEAGHAAVSGAGYCFGSDDGADFFRESRANREAFFRNWSIVTGVPVPEAVVDSPPFRCAC